MCLYTVLEILLFNIYPCAFFYQMVKTLKIVLILKAQYDHFCKKKKKKRKFVGWAGFIETHEQTFRSHGICGHTALRSMVVARSKIPWRDHESGISHCSFNMKHIIRVAVLKLCVSEHYCSPEGKIEVLLLGFWGSRIGRLSPAGMHEFLELWRDLRRQADHF